MPNPDGKLCGNYVGRIPGAVSPAIWQFTITTAGTGGFAGLKGGTLKKGSDTQVTITGLTPVTIPGSGQKITVAAEAQAAGVTVTASAKPVPTVKSVTLTGITTPETGERLTRTVTAPVHITGRTGGQHTFRILAEMG